MHKYIRYITTDSPAESSSFVHLYRRTITASDGSHKCTSYRTQSNTAEINKENACLLCLEKLPKLDMNIFSQCSQSHSFNWLYEPWTSSGSKTCIMLQIILFQLTLRATNLELRHTIFCRIVSIDDNMFCMTSASIKPKSHSYQPIPSPLSFGMRV